MVTVKPGQWVTSTAGRDRGKHYIVIRVNGDRSVAVADGVRRSQAQPKTKNLRHLWVHDRIHAELAKRLEAGETISNAEIEAALGELVRTEEEVG